MIRLVNGPPALVSHLATLIKLFLSHGSVPHFLLLCTLMPLVKDNLADITASENYRAISGGSLLLKLLDIVILLLEGDKLGFDQMQFAYQRKSSTTMCSLLCLPWWNTSTEMELQYMELQWTCPKLLTSLSGVSCSSPWWRGRSSPSSLGSYCSSTRTRSVM